ncbi:MAG: LysR family transcriptional regulator [Rhodospirillales bacterium]|nr:LysR family transcriptional regulator [Rhodospirillales bacterium]
MPTLKRLRYLVAVAETLHFRRAAALSNVSQPTLSGQLQDLEERLGVQLVERSRSRVVLTPIGKEIAARAKRVLSDVNDIVELAKYGGAPFGGTVRVGVLPTVGPYLLPHLLPDLHRTYPYLKLYLRERVTLTLQEGLNDGTFDALLTPLPISGMDLTVVSLYREPLVVALPADHPLTHKDAIERADLRGETVLALEPGHRLYEQVRELCVQVGASISLDFGGTSLDTLRLMVGMGMGLALLPALYARSEIPKDQNVVARPLRSRPPSRVVGMVWRRQSARAAEFSILADLFQRILSEKVPEVIPMR